MAAFKVAVSIFECGRVGPGESDEDRECNFTAVSERTKETKKWFYTRCLLFIHYLSLIIQINHPLTVNFK